ncbi:MAG: hypothetical protein MUP81_02940 [Dehalococcoidia bacterium]|nr:hypothetical protein [Dehalococcoidia bacterium]
MKYRVTFYDMFDGWLDSIIADLDDPSKPSEFDDLASALALRDAQNAKLNIDNKRAGEHYGVIDLQRNAEVNCPKGQGNWLQGVNNV